MAMVICAECGKGLSDKAASCPNCGAPLGAAGEAPVPAPVPTIASLAAAQQSATQQKGLSTGAKVLLGLLLFGLGLWVIDKLGDYGYPAAVIGLLACVGGIVLAVKTPNNRLALGIAAFAGFLVFLCGMASGSEQAKSQERLKAKERRMAQQKAQHDELAAKLISAPTTETYDLCVRISALGEIPADSNERCGTAYLDAGRQLVDAGKLADAREAINKAVAVAPTNNEARKVLAVVSTATALRSGEEHLRASRAAKDATSAVQLAKSAQADLEEALKLNAGDEKLKALSTRVQTQLARAHALQEKEDARKQQDALKAAEKREAALYLKESCNRLAGTFGAASPLSELQKEELWKQYEGKMFKWTMEFVDADSETLGDGFVEHWKCQDSDSFVSDVMIKSPANARSSVLELQKGAFYKVKGRLKRTSTLLGLTAESM